MDNTSELTLISDELKSAQQEIKTLTKSKNIYIRAVLHTLKSPITSGQLASSMLAEPKQQDRFIRIFTQIDNIINEFAILEELESNTQQLNKKSFMLNNLVDDAVKMCRLNEQHVNKIFESSFIVEVDNNLFVTAIKVMIENAQKYSDNDDIKISVDNDKIYFETIGRKLSDELSFYIDVYKKK